MHSRPCRVVPYAHQRLFEAQGKGLYLCLKPNLPNVFNLKALLAFEAEASA
jgi:hypothetical protein